MFKEITPMDALKLFLCGKDGIVIQQNEDGFSVDNFNDFFSEIERRTKFMVQTEEEQDVSDPVEEEQKVTDPFERYEKYGPFSPFSKPEPKKRGGKQEKGKAEELILKAWGGGEHSISEIMRMTGYSYQTVRRYIPISPKG